MNMELVTEIVGYINLNQKLPKEIRGFEIKDVEQCIADLVEKDIIGIHKGTMQKINEIGKDTFEEFENMVLVDMDKYMDYVK